MLYFHFQKGENLQEAYPELIQNPFVVVENDAGDQRLITSEKNKNTTDVKKDVNSYLQPYIENLWEKDTPLFRLIAIETSTRCNSACAFCPVNKHDDPRSRTLLHMDHIYKIASELSDLHYDGRICLFGNNEPLLDERIFDIIALFKKACPNSEIRLLTNGLLLTSEKVKLLFESGLTLLQINNYTDGSKLILPVKELIEEAQAYIDMNIKVHVRQIHEVLTTRAGQAKNKDLPREAEKQFCALPFVDLAISATGKVAQCSFDALGESDMGDIAHQSLQEIWKGSAFVQLRKSLFQFNRRCNSLCSKCDFDGFRDPYIKNPPLVREDLSSLNRE